MKFVSLLNSTIDVMLTLNVGVYTYDTRVSSSDNSQNCFLVINSKVINMADVMVSDCDALIQDSNVGQIKSLETTNEVRIIRTKIDTIFNQGLISMTGPLVLSDVHIGHQHKSGIIINPKCELILSNVTIDRCDEPCFALPVDSSYSFRNVVINNESVHNKSHRAFGFNAVDKVYQEEKKNGNIWDLRNATKVSHAHEFVCEYITLNICIYIYSKLRPILCIMRPYSLVWSILAVIIYQILCYKILKFV